MRNRFTQDPKSTFTPAALAALAAAGMMASPLVLAGTASSAHTFQNTSGSYSFMSSSSTNNAHMKGDVLRGATGRIGVNVASGSANSQDNATTVVTSSNKNNVLASSKQTNFATTTRSGSQGKNESNGNGNQEGSEGQSSITGPKNIDHMSNHVLQGASGDISVNTAAGNANQQANSTVLAKNIQSRGTRVSAHINQYSNNYFSLKHPDALNKGGTNKASIGNNVLRGASGNIGVNAAAGAQNQQANATAVSKGKGTVDEGAHVTQQAFYSSAKSNAMNNATLQGNALRGVSGNVGVNVASGSANKQANATSLADNSHTHRSLSSISQTLKGQTNTTPKAANTASITGSVFRGASGNIQANAASGQNNAQANTMAISLNNQALRKQATSKVNSQRVIGTTDKLKGGTNKASLSGHAFQGAKGNVSVNVASGSDNAQANSLTVVSK